MTTKHLLLSSALLALPLAATAQTPEPVGEPRDEIVVTGSRIALDPNLISSTPVQSLDSEDILLSGEINLSEIVNDIPALVSSTSTENSVSGGASLNLRGLGGARTLTLVNDRRHVAGFRGTSAVDVGSIPRALVERVEVTTGGASAIYGADAVTGVVNFILKDDFEGIDANLQGGISTEWDAEQVAFDVTVGKNFADDRGNVTLSVGVVDDSALFNGDRDWSRDNGIAFNISNPALRLQVTDLGADTPNLNAFGIGTLISGIDTTGLNLTATEQAILAREANAPRRIVARDPRVWLSSQEGSIAPGFGGRGITYIDVNNNGVADCQESLGGQIGFLAGCWVTNPDGSISVFEESLIADTSFRGLGIARGVGNAGAFTFNGDSLYPETDSYNINLNANYDLAPGLTAYVETKYVESESKVAGEQDTFFDTLFILPDNAFIPDQLRPVVDQTGGLLLTQDPVGYLTGDQDVATTTRETLRFVGGLKWETDSGHNFDVSFNHGRFEATTEDTEIFLDRQFAATDAVVDPATGEIVCRSSLDPSATYEIDFFTASNGFADGNFFSDTYYSFTPGDGQCQPLNPFGRFAVSPEAQNFIGAPVTDVIELEQTVISGIATGEFDWFANLLDGGVGYAAGFEWRREASTSTLDDNRLGILPDGSPFGGGTQVNTVAPFLNTLISIDNTQQFNTSGNYSVQEFFGEVRLPVFIDQPFAREFSLDGAVRYADYTTLGGQTTWKLGATWAPIEDLSFRGTLSSAVRAPNIAELFDPALPTFFGSNIDPCDPNNVTLGSAVRLDNCVAGLQAAGVPLSSILDGDGNYIFENPLSGRFAGTSGGNPDLNEETADTLTLGAVLTPGFLDRFTVTVDYWDIEIENAIGTVSGEDIAAGCYDSVDFPNVPLCAQFSRRADGGLDTLDSGTLNFARLEARGVDVAANYSFDWRENTFRAALVGSWQERLNRFFNPLNLDEVDPELEEVQRPEFSGNLNVGWERGPFGLNVQTTYQSNQFLAEITASEAAAESTDDGTLTHFEIYRGLDETGDTFIFDANGFFDVTENLRVYGGVNNITDEIPFRNQTAWPVSPRGRFLFLGVNAKY